MLQDVRFAIRQLVKGRWITAAAVAALALGIGANVARLSLNKEERKAKNE